METTDIDERLERLGHQEERLARALELLAQRAPKSGKDWDAYAAVIASFIGLLALAVSGYTAYVQRAQLRAQTWPHLQIGTTNVGTPNIAAINHGTGPARITAVRVMLHGAPMKTWWAVAKAAGFTENEGVTVSTAKQRVIAPGATLTMVQPWNDASRTKFLELLQRGKHPVSVTICYCSVLDECWVSALSELDADGDCPIPEGERFEG